MERVREAKFYPNYFTVKGRRTDRKNGYPEIEKIAKEKTFTGTKIALKIRNSVDLLVIPNNPKSRDLKMDLFS